ncbi:MAG: RDD family protein [Candidatus Dormibacteraeota bacterium]|nr:RDD family protein [Candidatus Dormibacteraeota bacterium]
MAELLPPQPPPAPSAPPYYAPAPAPYWPAPRGPAPGLLYAGFWIRFLAYVVDGIITTIPLWIVFFALLAPSFGNISCTTVPSPTGFGGTTTCTGLEFLSWFIPLSLLAGLLVPGAYFTFLWSHGGQSLGQKLCGLHVVDAGTGGGISTGRALGRFIGFLVSAYVVYIGLIWAAFDARKQGWHDKMASTFVVRRA